MESRRQLLAASTSVGIACASTPLALLVNSSAHLKQLEPALFGIIEMITAVLGRHLSATSATGKFTLLELPRLLRDKLDLTIIDSNSVNLPGFEPALIERLLRHLLGEIVVPASRQSTVHEHPT